MEDVKENEYLQDDELPLNASVVVYGVPSTGFPVNVGDAENTTFPVPVDAVHTGAAPFVPVPV